MRLLTQIMRIPVAVFVYGMDMLAKTMGGIQHIAEKEIDAILGITIQPEESATSNRPQLPNPATSFNGGTAPRSATDPQPATSKEESHMSDLDLRGDDAKLVRYFITFTRRDLEAYLGEETEVISYSTSAGDYQGAKKAEFLSDIGKSPAAGDPPNSLERPKKWIKKNYPPDDFLDPADKNRFIGLPADDVDEFLRVKVELLARYDRKPGEYDKDQADALEKLASTVKDGVIQVSK